jgi:ribosome biogenesis GTPase
MQDFETGRVAAEHRERYTVLTEEGELEAEVVGHLRFTAEDRSGFPAVGDWVALLPYNDSEAIIQAIYPRRSILERQAVGKFGEKQILAVNIDTALIVQAVDRDFNLNRLERYLAIAHASRIEPILLLNKIDLIGQEELDTLIRTVAERVREVPVIALSNLSGEGITELLKRIRKGKTYCILGSSGVGKSTLINRLSGKNLMATGRVSSSTGKGRHVTSRREMVVLPNGGILIDNPGMREVGLADTGVGLESTFDQIMELSRGCRYSDCRHQQEDGCAVIAALEEGELEKAAYENYLKMEREKSHFQSTLAEKRKKDKAFGKMVKGFKKSRKLNDGQGNSQ